MGIISRAKAFLITILSPLAGNLTYTVRHGLIKGYKRQGGLDFIPKRVLPSREDSFLHGLDLDGKVVFDIGGYEGLFTVFFSKKAGKDGCVYTFEPNPVNMHKIGINARLNGCLNVRLFPIAIGKERATMSMVVDSRRPASGSLNASIKSSIKQYASRSLFEFKVPVEMIDRLIGQHHRPLPVPDFVKIDVEGFELDVLQGMATLIRLHHPLLFIEIHGLTMALKIENVRNVVSYLVKAGYQILHVETRLFITHENAHLAAEGHLFAHFR